VQSGERRRLARSQEVTAADFPWPPLAGARPTWTGNGFVVNGRPAAVLAYTATDSGWTDDLTLMHEQYAGVDHPIDRMSRRQAVASVRKYLAGSHPVILDVGCSSGLLLTDLRAAFPSALVMGSDFLPGPLERLAAQTPDIPLLQFDMLRCPLPDASVDAITMLNVLEHISDDHEAVRQVVRILKPGGLLVVVVPAGPHLYDVYDEYLHHHRRYTAAGLTALLASCGLRILQRSHLGFLVYPAFAATKRRNQRHSQASADEKRRIVKANIMNTRSSPLLRAAFQLEGWLGRVASFPIGIRCVAVGMKPESR
jgi:ubiquinone/menaquinone biosynthesis C-methylase UbiE